MNRRIKENKIEGLDALTDGCDILGLCGIENQGNTMFSRDIYLLGSCEGFFRDRNFVFFGEFNTQRVKTA